MTRAIKFRGMDTHGGWHYGLVSMPKYGKYAGGVFISNGGGMPLAFEVRPETVGESTGRKDKNGVEIYEGDRVRRHITPWIGYQQEDESLIGIVKFGPKGWYLDCRVPEQWIGELLIKKGTLTRSQDRNEVIGNIHENPLEPTEKGE